jgi:hypothetical protein
MNKNSECGKRQFQSEIIWILFTIGCFILVGIFFGPPLFVGNGGQKANAIINNLRYIDAAKSQWAFEHGITNTDQSKIFTQTLSWKDIAPYLLRDPNVLSQNHFGSDGVARPISGEIYTINSLSKPPGVKLIHYVQFLPKGTIIFDPDKDYVYLNQMTNN